LGNSWNAGTLLTRVSEPGKKKNIGSDIINQILFIIKCPLLLQTFKAYREKREKALNYEIEQHTK
jgi:hypothetical protein